MDQQQNEHAHGDDSGSVEAAAALRELFGSDALHAAEILAGRTEGTFYAQAAAALRN